MAWYTVSVRLDDADKEQAKLIDALRAYPSRSAQRKVAIIECLIDAFVYNRKSVREALSDVEGKLAELAQIQVEQKEAPVVERIIEKVVQVAPPQMLPAKPPPPKRPETQPVSDKETSALLGEDVFAELARDAFS